MQICILFPDEIIIILEEESHFDLPQCNVSGYNVSVPVDRQHHHLNMTYIFLCTNLPSIPAVGYNLRGWFSIHSVLINIGIISTLLEMRPLERVINITTN